VPTPPFLVVRSTDVAKDPGSQQAADSDGIRVQWPCPSPCRAALR